MGAMVLLWFALDTPELPTGPCRSLDRRMPQVRIELQFVAAAAAAAAADRKTLR